MIKFDGKSYFLIFFINLKKKSNEISLTQMMRQKKLTETENDSNNSSSISDSDKKTE